jgi:hypothetical protein
MLRPLMAITLSLLFLTPAAQAQIGQALTVMKNNQPPPTPFDESVAPPAPDYALDGSWAALPDRRDPSDVAPPGVATIDQTHAPVDVFFVYPTTFFSKTDWNASVTDAANNAAVGAPLRSQASVFNGCCRVYAPYYRQMTFGGFIKWSDNSEKALDLAYRDVARAFDVFLKDHSKGRRFIIAAHSQGSRIARRLVAERIDGRPEAQRMVAAYLIGHWIESDWFKGLKDVTPCRRADDTGCVITWSSYAEGRNASLQRVTIGRASAFTPETIRRPYVCINPLSWSDGTARAPKTANRGAWMHGSGDTPRAVDVGLVSARCRDGALYVSRAGPPYQEHVIPFGNYHNLDYAVAWMNIRENLMTRIAAVDER